MNKKLSKILGALFPFVDFLHVLQMEEYHLANYFAWVKTRWWKRGFQKTGSIDWTYKVKFLFATALAIYFFSLAIFWQLSAGDLLLTILWLIMATALIPAIDALAVLVFSPFDLAIKSYYIQKARKKLQHLKDCRLITVAGSYGKTTTKNFLFQTLKEEFKVHTPTGNINTVLGLAQDILQNLSTEHQIYLVELGEYFPGDFARFFKLLPEPEIAILTAVGPQHIASFGSQKAVEAEFLAYLFLTQKAQQIVNADSPGNQKILKQYNQKVLFYFEKDVLKIMGSASLPTILEAQHLRENAAAAAKVAKILGVSEKKIQESLRQLETTERRMKIEKTNDIVIIDDSYNINPESAQAALNYLKQFKGNRKIVVTGGIVEQGILKEAQKNVEYGEKLAETADIIIVAKNIFQDYLSQGIKKSGRKTRIIFSDSPLETPNIIRRIIKAHDVILIQNELPDLYWS